jgi:nitrogen fixation/metabolism regulation signal transduction histidine kinase
MVYNSFQTSILTRITLLVINITALAYLYVRQERFFTLIFLALLVVIQIILLFVYLNKTNRNLARFLLLLTHEDTSVVQWKNKVEKTFQGLHHSFKKVNDEINRIRLEKEKGTILLQKVIDHVGTGIFAIDEDGSVELVNAAALEIFNLSRLDSLEDLDVVQDGLVAELSNLKYDSGNVIYFGQDDGATLPILVRVSLFTLEEKRLRLFSIQSIKTELEAKEIESWQQMTRVLAHEISNSVTPISTLADGIHRKLMHAKQQIDGSIHITENAAPDLLRSSELIVQRGNALVEFVEHYKSFTRLAEPVIVRVDIAQLFENISRYFNRELEQAGIKLLIDVAEGAKEVQADPNLIEQALINLIRNAISALPDNADATIALSSKNEGAKGVTLEVSDNGAGIPPEIQSQIFIPFFTTKQKGTGIGLSIVRKILNMHGGNIHVRTQEGRGSTFVIRLPQKIQDFRY